MNRFEPRNLTGFRRKANLTGNLSPLSNRDMKSFSYTEARDRLKHLMDQVNEETMPPCISGAATAKGRSRWRSPIRPSG